jgi:hypothetical protein
MNMTKLRPVDIHVTGLHTGNMKSRIRTYKWVEKKKKFRKKMDLGDVEIK